MDSVEKTALAESDVEEKTQWHNAFFVAIQAQLIEYKDDLAYEQEHPLTTEPLRIDTIVIKKRPKAVIRRQIAEIFRLVNHFEYKNPGDSLSESEFYKSVSRVYLYKSSTDAIKITEMTLSFVVTVYPRELFKYLQETPGYSVEERHPGVFVVTGERIPIQVLYTVDLSEEENRWIRNLKRNLTEKDLNWLSQQQKEYGLQLDLSAYLYAVLNANQELLKRIWEDKRMLTAETCEIIEKIGWGDKWRQEGRQEGEARGKIEIVRNMLKRNKPISEIIEDTGVSREEVENERRLMTVVQ